MEQWNALSDPTRGQVPTLRNFQIEISPSIVPDPDLFSDIVSMPRSRYVDDSVCPVVPKGSTWARSPVPRIHTDTLGTLLRSKCFSIPKLLLRLLTDAVSPVNKCHMQVWRSLASACHLRIRGALSRTTARCGTRSLLFSRNSTNCQNGARSPCEI